MSEKFNLKDLEDIRWYENHPFLEEGNKNKGNCHIYSEYFEYMITVLPSNYSALDRTKA